MFFCEYSHGRPLALQTRGDSAPNYKLGLAGYKNGILDFYESPTVR